MDKIFFEHNRHWLGMKYDVKPRQYKIELDGRIFVVSGMRRVGKSFVLLDFINCFQGNKYNIFYLNFFDGRLEKYKNIDGLQKIFDMYLKTILEKDGDKNSPIYLLLDEIQEVKDWYQWILGIYETKFYNVNFIISGSNANLLSGEIGTYLVGRYKKIHIYPLSLQEFLDWNKFKYNNKSIHKNYHKFLNLLDKYMFSGQLPEAVLGINIYDNILNDIIYKDIIRRYKIKHIKCIEELCYYFVTNIGCRFNYNSIKNTFNINETTVKEYTHNIKSSFLIDTIEKLEFSIKKLQKSDKKVYTNDTGMVSYHNITNYEKKGPILENLVYNYLRQLGKIFFWYDNTAEVDFVLTINKKIEGVFQVCREMSDKAVKNREIKGLINFAEKFGYTNNLYIITYNQEENIEIQNKYIKIIPFYKYIYH